MEIDLLDRYPKSKRPIEERANSATEEDRKLARRFEFEYFDGTRNQGYGGYRYDGRWKPVVQRFIQHYDLTNQSSVLDVGAAKGFMLHDFREVLPGAKLAGIDVSRYAYDNAMDSVKPDLRIGNAKELPFESKSFDLVISINTIHNLKLDDLKQSLREIERVSKRHKFVVVDAYRTEEEKSRLLKWNLTAMTHMYTSEWESLFQEVGYNGDYYWFIP